MLLLIEADFLPNLVEQFNSLYFLLLLQCLPAATIYISTPKYNRTGVVIADYLYRQEYLLQEHPS